MNVIESLKNFFKRFRKGESEEQKLLTAGQTSTESKWKEELVRNSQVREPLRFQRDDGSIITLTPRMQLNGEQECKVIKNEKTGNLVRIPIYDIPNEEYKPGEVQILAHEILLDMTVEQLQNMQPDEISFFSNDLLSQKRLKRVLDEYSGYAGGIGRKPNTRRTNKDTN